MNVSYDLERFVRAQENSYAQALDEMRCGRKCSCWMWYIFPQLAFLGQSDFAKYYGISDIDHARAYLSHPILGPRLREISRVLLEIDENNALRLMGSPDHLKLKSCMTLFNQLESDSVFQKVLDKFYGGRQDDDTIKWLKKHRIGGGAKEE